jgi:argininosuccinate synthase
MCALRTILCLFSVSCYNIYSYESGVLEDPAELAPAGIFQMTLDPQNAPENPCKLQINFEHGIIQYSMGINFVICLKLC